MLRDFCVAASGSLDTPGTTPEPHFSFFSRQQFGGQVGCYDAIKLHDTCILRIISTGKKHWGDVWLSFFDDEGQSCGYSVWKQQQETSQEPFTLMSKRLEIDLAQIMWGRNFVCTVDACLAQLGSEVCLTSRGRAHQSQLIVSNTQDSSLLDAQGISWNWLETTSAGVYE